MYSNETNIEYPVDNLILRIKYLLKCKFIKSPPVFFFSLIILLNFNNDDKVKALVVWPLQIATSVRNDNCSGAVTIQSVKLQFFFAILHIKVL